MFPKSKFPKAASAKEAVGFLSGAGGEAPAEESVDSAVAALVAKYGQEAVIAAAQACESESPAEDAGEPAEEAIPTTTA